MHLEATEKEELAHFFPESERTCFKIHAILLEGENFERIHRMIDAADPHEGLLRHAHLLRLRKML